MTARLRAYLKSIGIADSVLDKMEKGEPPDDPDVLRKAHETVENHPALVECRKLVRSKRTLPRSPKATGNAAFPARRTRRGYHQCVRWYQRRDSECARVRYKAGAWSAA
jgi:hypothetical protein